MTLEVCVDSVQSALNAVTGGATRLELCSCLDVGGLTPSMGLVRRVRHAVAVAGGSDDRCVAIHLLVRPSATEHFVYSSEELQVMVEDIRLFKEEEVDGIVVGVLTSDGCVDVGAMNMLIDAARPLPVTFHRAIDVCRDPIEALDVAAGLGCRRVLTSGQEPTALLGSRCIKRMIVKVEEIGSDVVIMPGGGIDAENVLDIVRATGATELHASCRSLVVDASGERRNPRVTMGSRTIDVKYICDTRKVAAVVRILKSAASNPGRPDQASGTLDEF